MRAQKRLSDSEHYECSLTAPVRDSVHNTFVTFPLPA
jgi:hypothetical protein